MPHKAIIDPINNTTHKTRFVESPVCGDVVVLDGEFVAGSGFGDVVSEGNLAMLSVFVAPQVVQVYVFAPSASFVASVVIFPSSHT